MTGMLVWIEGANARGGVAGRRVGLLAADGGGGGGGPDRAADEVRALSSRARVAAVVGVCCGLPEVPPLAGGTPVLFPLGGGFGASTPPWARFGPDELAAFLPGRDEAVPDAFFGDQPEFAPLRDAFRALHGRPPTRAALFGYAAMRGFAAAVEAAGGTPPELAAPAVIPPGRLPTRAYLGQPGR
jgi:ABC-type branched-subunit amino acid transport system substrate-binding protein